jgi:putative ABC transport system permease protein
MTANRPTWPLRLARLLVRVAARLAPGGSEERLRQEWLAELDADAGLGSRWGLVRAALGAFADARSLHQVQSRPADVPPGPTVGASVRRGLADVGAAVRTMRRMPAFATTAIGTLALGIGASTAIFTLIDRVVLDPLPYPEASRLVRIQNRVPGVSPKALWTLSIAQYVYFTDHARTLASVGLYRSVGGNIVTPTGPERVNAVLATASMMDLLGVRAFAGRLITPADDTPGSAPVVLVSTGFWRRRLNGSPTAVGTTLTYNDKPVEIIGILGEDIDLPGAVPRPDLWLPMRVNRQGPFWNEHSYPGVARLAPGATPTSAQAELAVLTTQFPRVFPDAYDQAFFDRYGFRTDVLPLKDAVVGDLSRTLWIVFGGVALVLLIACANVANLFAARIDGRQREMAVRAALGAGRWTLARLVLVEGATLALVAGSCALVVGLWGVPALTALAPPNLPRVHGIGLGGHTVVFGLVLSVLAGVLVTAYPAVRAARARATDSSGDGNRSATAGRERQRMRSGLVIVEVALALTLAVVAGLLLASLGQLRAIDTGVSPTGVLTADVYLSPPRYANDQAVWQAYREMLTRVRALPGVVAAGMSEQLPVRDNYGCTIQGFEDSAVFDRLKAAGFTACAGQEPTSPGYFEGLGIPLVAGRSFVDADNDDPTRASVIVSQAFAKRFWPGETALGKGVAPNGRSTGPFYRVVGVVGDVVQAGSEGVPPLSQRAIAIYYPMRHDPRSKSNSDWWPGKVTLVVRTRLADPTVVVPALRHAISAVDPTLPLANISTMETVIAEAAARLAFVSLLLEIAAAVALCLAAVGLYAVLSYVVSRRTREIGTRLAIGAPPSYVLRVIIGQSLALVGAGLVAGLGLSLLAARTMQALLVGIGPADPRVYAVASTALGFIAVAASWLPARRAARIDPVMALRSE